MSNLTHRDRRVHREALKALADRELLTRYATMARGPLTGPRCAAAEARDVISQAATLRRQRSHAFRRDNENISYKRDPRQMIMEIIDAH